MTTPTPGVFQKGHTVRVADTAAEAVALAFEGFVKQTPESVADGATRRELQDKAKELGIPANQSSAVLAEAIANYVPEPDEVEHSSATPTPDLSYVSGLSGDDAGATDSDVVDVDDA